MKMNQANKNFFTNIIYLGANVIVGIVYTPYLVHHLGIAAYGVVPLALIINQYIGVLSLSLVNALTRFYSVEYRKGNLEAASKYFSTAITTGVLFSILVYPVLEVFIQNVNYIFDIPHEFLNSAIWLFRFTIISFFLSIISTCINSTLFADNYLDSINYIKLVRQASKLVLNILLFVSFATDILYVGLTNLISEILVLIMSIYYYYEKKPEGIHYKWTWFEMTYLLGMLGMIVWIMLQRFADTFLYKIDSIIMNEYFGIKMTGVIGAISEFGSYVTSITAVFGSLLGPILLINYSKGDMDKYKNITINGSYIIGLISALFCGLLIGSGSQILALWLGREYATYNDWLAIKLIVIPFTAMGSVYANGYVNANKNKYPAIFSLLISVMNILFVIAMLTVIRSILLFMVVCMIFIIIQGYFMNTYFYSKIYSNKNKNIVVNVIKVMLFCIITSCITFGGMYIIPYSNMVNLITVYLLVFSISVIIAEKIFLSTEQRILLFKLVPALETIYTKFRKK